MDEELSGSRVVGVACHEALGLVLKEDVSHVEDDVLLHDFRDLSGGLFGVNCLGVNIFPLVLPMGDGQCDECDDEAEDDERDVEAIVLQDVDRIAIAVGR